MMTRLGRLLLILLTTVFASRQIGHADGRITAGPADQHATPATSALYRRLHAQAGHGILFGQQDASAYGVGWEGESGRSDVRDVCGSHPAVYGWDLGDIHRENNIDGVSFVAMKQLIREADACGGINTISAHLDNPVTGRNAWDNTEAVRQILPGGTSHADYLQTLDRIAAFLNDLKRADGTAIPIVFRPYHEHNQDWPWWGRNHCSEANFIALWRMTIEHLRKTRGVHNLLYAISPQDVVDEKNYMDGYPGDAYVDVFGLDYYRIWNRGDVAQMGKILSMVARLAAQHGKVSALTECGINRIRVPKWWTSRLLPALEFDEWSRRTAWALVWRNQSRGHHFGPFLGHRSSDDFIKFYESPLTIFAEGLSNPDEIHALQRAFVEEALCLSNVAMISRKGQVVYHRAVDSKMEGDRPITDDTQFAIWSMTKPITSIAAMILHERGAFKLDEPVSKTIPQLANLNVKTDGGTPVPLERQITFRDLLRHTSGIYGYDGSFDRQGTWKEVMELGSLAEMIDLLETKPIEHQPTERYTYGLSTAVMGRAIEILSGMSLAEFFAKEIFDPLGMDKTRFHLSAGDREHFQPLFVKEGDKFRPGIKAEDELYYAPGSQLFLGGEGLVSNIKDYGRFCQMLVNRGKSPDGKQLISGKTLDLMLTDQLGSIDGYGGGNDGYIQGLGFTILEDPSKKRQNSPAGIFSWGGYHTTYFWIDPKNELYGIFMTRRYPAAEATESRLRKVLYGALKPTE